MDKIKEGCTARLTAVLKDETGATVTSLDALTLTLYEADSGTIINTKNGTNVLPYFSAGTVTITLTAADNAKLTTAPTEVHVALLEWTYGTTKKGKGPISFIVEEVEHAH